MGKWLKLSLCMAGALAVSWSCTNNPFNPRAEVTVTSVEGGEGSDVDNQLSFPGIQRLLKKTGPYFTYFEPKVKLKNGDSMPQVIFDQAVVKVTIGQIELPPKKVPVTLTLPKGGELETEVKILSYDDDVREAVYPNASASVTEEGGAVINLIGKDRNGNEVSVSFATNLRFSNRIDDDVLEALTSASASPSAE